MATVPACEGNRPQSHSSVPSSLRVARGSHSPVNRVLKAGRPSPTAVPFEHSGSRGLRPAGGQCNRPLPHGTPGAPRSCCAIISVSAPRTPTWAPISQGCPRNKMGTSNASGPPQNLCTDVHSSATCNSPSGKDRKRPGTHGWINELWDTHTAVQLGGGGHPPPGQTSRALGQGNQGSLRTIPFM